MSKKMPRTLFYSTCEFIPFHFIIFCYIPFYRSIFYFISSNEIEHILRKDKILKNCE